MIVALVQVALFAVLAPLLIGVTRQVRARVEGRVGAGVLQPWRDLRKLLMKQPVRARGSSWILRAGPMVVAISSLVLAALLPLVTTVGGRLVPGDLFVVVSVLLIGAVALALVGLDGGTAFGGMGSSRQMTVVALVEPTLLLVLFTLSLRVPTRYFQPRRHRRRAPRGAQQASSLSWAECSRSPRSSSPDRR